MPRSRTPRPTLAVKGVEAATRQASGTGKPAIIWCGAVSGFGAKITPTGRVAWIWQGYVSGRQRRVTLNAEGDLTLSQARDAARNIQARVALGENVPDQRVAKRVAEKLTVRTLIDRYFDERGSKRLRPRTAFDYRAMLDRNIIPAFGARPAADLRHEDVVRQHSKITARGAARQANYTVAILRAVYSWAIKTGLVMGNPAKGIDLNPEGRRERFASDDETRRLLEVMASWPDRIAADALKLLLWTGARSGEVLNATWGQFDLDTSDRPVWTKPAATTKQKKVHRLPLAAAAADMLRGIREARPGTAAAHVFPRGDGGRMTDRDFATRWAAVRQVAGLDDFKKHDLRHTAASMLAASGASLPLIGAVLGHSTPITTSRYAHLVDGVTRGAVERIAENMATAEARPPQAGAGVVSLHDAMRKI